MTAAGEVVAEHVLVAPGAASVHDEHYGGPRPAPRAAVRPKTTAEKEFCALGPVAEAFITGAAAAETMRLGPELAELGTLRAAHGDEAFAAALDRAVAFGRWRAADVRSILAAGSGPLIVNSALSFISGTRRMPNICRLPFRLQAGRLRIECPVLRSLGPTPLHKIVGLVE